MQRLSVWMGTVFVTAGVTAAFLAGPGVAAADPGSDSSSSSSSSQSSSSNANDKPDKQDRLDKKDRLDRPKKHEKPEKPESATDSGPKAPEPKDTEPEEPTSPPAGVDDTAETPLVKPASKPTLTKRDAVVEQQAAVVAPRPAAPEVTPTQDELEPTAVAEEVTPDVEKPVATATDAVKTQEAQPLSAIDTTTMRTAEAAVTTTIAPPPSPLSVFDAIGSAIGAIIGSIVVSVGSIVINTLQAVEALVTGPPVLPPNSTVTVRSSTITLSTGQRVAANWYYPEGDVPPDRMILLSHGFFALGPMYSYTAANLAQATNSIVVTPTLPSNFFAPDDQWLGGTGMAKVMAELFVGDREALTRSAINAGYATRYGLDPATAALPQKFGLAGHSLGGQLVSGMAGYLAENGAADDLVGVITLDGVPTGTTVADALDKLDYYELHGGHYIPIREIGAPWNLFNSISNINQSLNEGRPGRYNGVILDGGVHMDSMRGGNPLIQFVAYLVAGIPRPINPPAVDYLAATWFNQWFDGQTDIGDDLVPGSTIDIVTPQGVATGVVIGSAPAVIPRRDPAMAALSA